MTATARVKLTRLRTGFTAGDIIILLGLLAWAWTVIGWHAVAVATQRLNVNGLFWTFIICIWPLTRILEFAGVLAPDPLASVLDSSLVACAFLSMLTRERRRREIERRAWIEQKAAIKLRRADTRPAAPSAAPAQPDRLSQWNAARLHDHDQWLADIDAKAGEFLWVAREVAALAGLPPYKDTAEKKPDLRLVRGGETS